MPRTIILYGHGSYRPEDVLQPIAVPANVTLYFFTEHNGEISEHRMQEIADLVLYAAREGQNWLNDPTIRQHIITPAVVGGQSCINYRLKPPYGLLKPNFGREIIHQDAPLVYGTGTNGITLSQYFAYPSFNMPGTSVLWVACRAFNSAKVTPDVRQDQQQRFQEFRSPLVDMYLDGKQNNKNYHRQ